MKGSVSSEGSSKVRLEGFHAAFLERGFEQNVTIEINGSKISRVAKDQPLSSGKNSRTMDMTGLTALPGLIDAHAHLFSLENRSGRSCYYFQLPGARSIGDIEEIIRERCKGASKAAWLIGTGLDQEKLKERRFPSRGELERACNDHALLIVRTCGHLGIANSLALTAAEKRFAGFHSPKDGVVKEESLHIVRACAPLPSVSDLNEALEQACSKAASAGLTSIHTLLSKENWEKEAKAARELFLEKKPMVRLRLYFPPEFLEQEVEEFNDPPDFLEIGGVKIFCDGSLGARTAFLQVPYLDDPNNKGMRNYASQELIDMIEKAKERNLQVATHAIGDAAVRQALDCIETVFGRECGSARPRIEHASLLPPDLMKRAEELGVVLVVQPMFAVSDEWVEERVGKERSRWVYPFKAITEAGLPVAASSDAPHETLDPLAGMQAFSVKRSFGQDQLIPLESAIIAYTRGSSYAGFSETRTGRISPGFLADLTILSGFDTLNTRSIKRAKVAATIVGGVVTYASDDRFSLIEDISSDKSVERGEASASCLISDSRAA